MYLLLGWLQHAEDALAFERARLPIHRALCRDLDPDRQITAIAVAVFGGAWALLGMETAILPFAGLLLVARLLVETTGRRPIPGDLLVVALAATLVSLTPLGWVMGFGLAVAILVGSAVQYLARSH